MIKRREVIANAQEEERLARQKEKQAAAAMNVDSGAANRDVEKLDQFVMKQALYDPANKKPLKQIKDFDQKGRLPTTFFSMNSPDYIEDTLVKVLKEAKIDAVVDQNKYKISFTQTGALPIEDDLVKYEVRI